MPRLLVVQLWILIGLLGGWPAGTQANGTTAHEVMCMQPFLLSVSQIGTQSAFFDWTPTGSEMHWDLAVLPHGAPPPGLPTVENIDSSQYLFTGLQPGTAYDFYVRADCGNGQVSSWSAYSSYFITQMENPSACPLELAIPDGGCQTFKIVVGYPGGGQLGQNLYLQAVDLILRHEWADDLDMQLTAPDGTVVILSTDNGNGEENYGDPDDPTCSQRTHLVNLSDEAACQALSIVDEDAPFIGTYLPEGDFNNFNTGGPVNGIWELRVCDDVLDDVGSLEFVELHFAPMNCPAPRALEALQVDSTSVLLDWLPGGNCPGTIIEYGAP
ncbi:MAG: fibronectin type III domain-containing protein, partial [Phaeodactylibacter sp.]|nr:fibronectin type III domain-containing protein [Phaeodactylibacter sp.]